MTPINFPEANCRFGPPPDLDESQCRTIFAFRGPVATGSCEGAEMVVTAWKPDANDLVRLNAGEPLFLTVFGGLPPHMVTTNFQEATNPA